MEEPLLIFSTTRNDADLRYLIGTHVPDDIALVYEKNKTTALASALEINRLKKFSKINELVAWEDIKNSIPSAKKTDFDILKKFLEKIGLKKFCVKGNFSVYLADRLRQDGFEIVVSEQTILPQRLIKNDFEITEIIHAAEIVKLTFVEVEKILANSSINKKNELVFEDEILTSEKLREIMEKTCFLLGAIAENTIIACGTDACDPHNIGYGPLKANELIVVDFFPFLKSSGYYADVSRTFLKGRANGKQIKMYNAVKEAHDRAIEMAKKNTKVTDIMQKVFKIFESNGYQSDKSAKPPHGMIHGLGHGLGLDIHEPPRLGLCDDVLRTGMAVTIEPGLYYQEIGGVRIEDDILIGQNSCQLLTQIPYNFIIE